MSIWRNVAAGGLATLAITAGATAFTSPAAAQWRGGWGYGWHGGWGYPVAAGVATGLAVGAIAGAPYYGGYGPGGCYLRRQPAYGPYGEFLGYRRVRVCY